MLYFVLGFLLLYLAAFLISLKNVEDWQKKLDKKEHKLSLLYPLAYLILRRTGLEKILSRKDNITESIKALYLTSKPEILSRLFWCRRISLVLVILFLVNLMSFIALLSAKGNSLLINGKYIERPHYGEGSSQVKLSVSVKNQEKENSPDIDKAPPDIDKATPDIDKASSDIEKTSPDIDKTPGSFDLSINIDEQSYTDEELEIIFNKSFDYLEKEVLGSNTSADYIYGNLNFVGVIPGTSVKADWIPEDYSLIQSDGTIMNEDINQEGIWTTVTVILSYGGKESVQQKEQSMAFRIMPKQYEDEYLLRQKLVEEIDTASEETKDDKYLELPGALEEYQLTWADNRKSSGLTFLFLGVILTVAVWLLGDKELEKQMKIRKEQMLVDYPEIINKFTLLINAGMTIKQAWIKMSEDYFKMKSEKGARKRYAYEEMLTTAHELKLGLPENGSYEQYGKRCGLTPYIKFSSLISQNLKKGTKGFTELLMYEAIEAFEERKEVAKRLGEEAGTKLLIPMMIMLAIVFLIIMIPAFLSFRI